MSGERTIDDRLKKLEEINNIHNIMGIYFDERIPSVGEGIKIIPKFTVEYDLNKHLIYDANDDCFIDFVRKIKEVYLRERKNDGFVDDPLDFPGMHSSIKIDERAKKILETDELLKLNDICTFYDNKEGYEIDFIFPQRKLKILLPLIEYHLNLLLNFIGYENNSYLNGNLKRGTSNLPSRIGNYNDNLEVSFSFYDSNIVNVIINSHEKLFKEVRMQIVFNYEGLTVDARIEDMNLIWYSEYKSSEDNKMIYRYEVGTNNTIIDRNYGSFEECDNPFENIINPNYEEGFKWYKMPWNAYYGLKNEVDLTELDNTLVNKCKYIAVEGNEFLSREYLSKRYIRRTSSEASSKWFILEDICKLLDGIIINPRANIYLVETRFIKVDDISGYSKKKLEGKYFYHIIQDDNLLDGINRDNAIPLDKNIVEMSGDLYREEYILSLIDDSKGKERGGINGK